MLLDRDSLTSSALARWPSALFNLDCLIFKIDPGPSSWSTLRSIALRVFISGATQMLTSNNIQITFYMMFTFWKQVITVITMRLRGKKTNSWNRPALHYQHRRCICHVTRKLQYGSSLGCSSKWIIPFFEPAFEILLSPYMRSPKINFQSFWTHTDH